MNTREISVYYITLYYIIILYYIILRIIEKYQYNQQLKIYMSFIRAHLKTVNVIIVIITLKVGNINTSKYCFFMLILLFYFVV